VAYGNCGFQNTVLLKQVGLGPLQVCMSIRAAAVVVVVAVAVAVVVVDDLGAAAAAAAFVHRKTHPFQL